MKKRLSQINTNPNLTLFQSGVSAPFVATYRLPAGEIFDFVPGGLTPIACALYLIQPLKVSHTDLYIEIQIYLLRN